MYIHTYVCTSMCIYLQYVGVFLQVHSCTVCFQFTSTLTRSPTIPGALQPLMFVDLYVDMYCTPMDSAVVNIVCMSLHMCILCMDTYCVLYVIVVSWCREFIQSMYVQIVQYKMSCQRNSCLFVD